MAAIVHAPPAGIKIPQWAAEPDEDRGLASDMGLASWALYVLKCQKWLAGNGYTGELAGEYVRWPHRVGYARYLVMQLRPLSLMHLPLGDAWNLDDRRLRELRPGDVRENIEMLARLAGI